MINRITIKIPYPKKFGIISFNTTKKVTFWFDNYAMFIFREDNKINTAEDLDKWRKEHGDYDFFARAAFSAVKSYCVQNRKKCNLELNKFALGLASADKDDIVRLTDVWKKSQEYGHATPPGKKKRPKRA
jgi:hypothetical protein